MRTITYLGETKPIDEHVVYWAHMFDHNTGTIEAMEQKVQYLEDVLFKLLEVLPKEQVAHALGVSPHDIQDS